MSRFKAFSLGCISAIGLSACANTQPATWTYRPDNNHVGRIYYYERSNTDGSLDERISIFHRDETSLEVYKENGICRNAAFVSATMDWNSFSAERITGGQLQPDAQQMEFAFLTWEKDASKLAINVRFPGGEIHEEAPIETIPWHLYDFDFASLTVATQHLTSSTDDFSFGMALVWTDPSADDPLVWMGDVQATYGRTEERLGVSARRYELTGAALTGPRTTGGPAVLWLDAESGHIVDAELPVPNHAGYTDLRLKLLRTSDGGDAEWTQLLKAHFADC